VTQAQIEAVLAMELAKEQAAPAIRKRLEAGALVEAGRFRAEICPVTRRDPRCENGGELTGLEDAGLCIGLPEDSWEAIMRKDPTTAASLAARGYRLPELV
jgi:hypothetical protein